MKIDAAGIGGLCASAAMAWVLMLVGGQVLDTAVVHISHTTGECVRVLTPDGDKPCDAMPDRYSVVIVK